MAAGDETSTVRQSSQFFSGVPTQLKIMHAIDKPLARMSVSELCQKAGVSRQTFYHYFANKDEIAAWFSQHCEQFYLDEAGRTLDPQIAYELHFRLMCTEARTLSLALSDELHIPIFGSHSVSQRRRDVLIETLSDYRHLPIDDDLLFSVECFVHLETEVFAHWCKVGLTDRPQAYARRMIAIMPSRLMDALRLP